MRRRPKVERNHSVNSPPFVPESEVSVWTNATSPSTCTVGSRWARRGGAAKEAIQSPRAATAASCEPVALQQRRREVGDDGVGGRSSQGPRGVPRRDRGVPLVQHGQDLLGVGAVCSVMVMPGCRDRARGLDTPATMSSTGGPTVKYMILLHSNPDFAQRWEALTPEQRAPGSGWTTWR